MADGGGDGVKDAGDACGYPGCGCSHICLSKLSEITSCGTNLERAVRAAECLHGARVVDIAVRDNDVVFWLQHRGTDDDAAMLVVPASGIRFEDDDEKPWH